MYFILEQQQRLLNICTWTKGTKKKKQQRTNVERATALQHQAPSIQHCIQTMKGCLNSFTFTFTFTLFALKRTKKKIIIFTNTTSNINNKWQQKKNIQKNNKKK